MANVSEHPLRADTAKLIQGASGDGLRALNLEPAADPESVIDAIDAFVDAWQQGKRAAEKAARNLMDGVHRIIPRR